MGHKENSHARRARITGDGVVTQGKCMKRVFFVDFCEYRFRPKETDSSEQRGAGPDPLL